MPEGAVAPLGDGFASDAAAWRPGLREIAGDGLRAWRLLLSSTVVAVALVVLALWSIQPRYTATMVVGPTARSGPAAMGARLPLGGGVASRALSEPGVDELLSDFARYTQLLASVPVAERLARDKALMRTLFADEWDGRAEAWRPSRRPVAVMRRLLLGISGRDAWAPPDAERLSRLLRMELIVRPVADSPMRAITFRHADRDFALALVGAVHDAADRAIREEAARRVGAEIDYLAGRLATETAADHRRALAGLMTEQERVRMMIDVSLPFAADRVEPPSAPALPDWPDPMAALVAAPVAGFFIGFVLVYLRRLWRTGAA